MNIEDRLRAELDRSGRSTAVGTAPSIDDLAAVANERRHRNRVLGASGAVILSSGILFGSFFAFEADTESTVDSVAAGDVAADNAADVDAELPEASQGVEAAPVDDDAASTGPADDVSETEDAGGDAIVDEPADPDSEGAPVEPDVELEIPDTIEEVTVALPPASGFAAALQADNASMEVESRQSAVGLASGSGVLIVPSATGYVGLASSFGNSSSSTLSLASTNGLDWTSSEVVGVPDGATASILREYNGTYVALFERFDSNAGVKRVHIGTSTNTVTWDVSAPLAGSEVYATDLAVGSPGVIIIGDDQSPQVWSGPIGGPYARTGKLAASALNGVTAVDDSFVVAGRTRADGVVLFTSANAADWTMRPLSSPDDARSNQSVSVSNGTVVLRNPDDAKAGTLISSDAGATWSALPAPSSRGVSVSSSTMGFLGADGSDAIIAVSDGATFSTAQLDVAAPDRLSLVAAGNGEIVMVQTTESGTTWIVVRR